MVTGTIGRALDRALLPEQQPGIYQSCLSPGPALPYRSATTLLPQTRPSRRDSTPTSQTRTLSDWPRLCAACVGLPSSWARCCPSKMRASYLPRYLPAFVSSSIPASHGPVLTEYVQMHSDVPWLVFIAIKDNTELSGMIEEKFCGQPRGFRLSCISSDTSASHDQVLARYIHLPHLSPG